METPAEKIPLIYLMGAGRSGTTLFSTLLDGAEGITTLGEMHQLLDYILEDKPCSCGKSPEACEFWDEVRESLLSVYSEAQLRAINDHNQKVESHQRILLSWIKKDNNYIAFQEQLFQIIARKRPSKYYLDSAKFISRAMQLKKSAKLDVKLIYVVRDVRGVIHSFGKKVQTTKSPLSTLAYVNLINFFAQNLAWTMGRKQVLRVRYEDLILNSRETLERIQEFIGHDLSSISEKIEKGEEFPMPHIIGGNRMKSQASVKIKKDFTWKTAISRAKQLIYYLCALPYMAVNKYKI